MRLRREAAELILFLRCWNYAGARLWRQMHSPNSGLDYCAVSVNGPGEMVGCPNPNGPSAVTVTVPAVAGRVSVTLATPELSVTAMTLDPVKIFSPPTDTLVSDPALVTKRTLAPAAEPPDCPGANFTARAVGRGLPTLPVCALPAVRVKLAAGLPTNTQPLCVVDTLLLSVAGTENE